MQPAITSLVEFGLATAGASTLSFGNNMNDDSVRLRLSAQRALWGHVPACLRSASIEKVEDTIRWRCVFDIEATDDDFELARMAGGEIIADFSAPTIMDEQIVKSAFPDKIAHLEHLIFLRHEHNYYKE